MLKKVISGGQTGIDRLGLDIAKELGIATGGTAPKGYRTEKGPDTTLIDLGLVESSSFDYPVRTSTNVIDSDGTVLFGDMESTGSALTIKILKDEGRPYIANPTAAQLVDFVRDNEINTLNVAGNRASKLSPSKLRMYGAVLRDALIELLSPKMVKT